MEGYKIDVLNRIQKPDYKEAMEKEFDHNGGEYLRHYEAAVKNPVLCYHKCLSEIFLDEHAQKLVTLLFDNITLSDNIKRTNSVVCIC